MSSHSKQKAKSQHELLPPCRKQFTLIVVSQNLSTSCGLVLFTKGTQNDKKSRPNLLPEYAYSHISLLRTQPTLREAKAPCESRGRGIVEGVRGSTETQLVGERGTANSRLQWIILGIPACSQVHSSSFGSHSLLPSSVLVPQWLLHHFHQHILEQF